MKDVGKILRAACDPQPSESALGGGCSARRAPERPASPRRPPDPSRHKRGGTTAVDGMIESILRARRGEEEATSSLVRWLFEPPRARGQQAQIDPALVHGALDGDSLLEQLLINSSDDESEALIAPLLFAAQELVSVGTLRASTMTP